MQIALAIIGSGILSIIVSWLLGRLDKKKDKQDLILSRIFEVEAKVDKHIALDDERYAIDCRVRIQRFNDELLHGIRHSQEHFKQTLSDITVYNNYCDAHKDFPNEVTTTAAENIRRVYMDCQVNHSFL